MKKIRLVGGILVFAIFLCLLYISICNVPRKYTTTDTETYTVKAGETLWNIAKQYTDGDPRRLIYEIEQINDTTADIRPGQVLKIPVSR